MINFELNQKKSKLPLKAKLEKLSKVISKEFKKDGIISVAIIDSKTSKRLNKTYRRKNKPADILTFVYKEDDSLGEIILSYEEIKKRAKNEKKNITETILELIIHGICHIFGYGHKDNNEARRMERKEQEIKEKM